MNKLLFNLHTEDLFQTQFNHAVVEIVPGDLNTNLVRLLVKPELSKFVSWDKEGSIRLVSDDNLPVLTRQMAVHANVSLTDNKVKNLNSKYVFYIARCYCMGKA